MVDEVISTRERLIDAGHLFVGTTANTRERLLKRVVLKVALPVDVVFLVLVVLVRRRLVVAGDLFVDGWRVLHRDLTVVVTIHAVFKNRVLEELFLDELNELHS